MPEKKANQPSIPYELLKVFADLIEGGLEIGHLSDSEQTVQLENILAQHGMTIDDFQRGFKDFVETIGGNDESGEAPY